MTPAKRILVNVIASYGRTMLGIACGLFSVRWVLEALGEVDYGLYGVIGSMLIFVRFFNIQFSNAISRFFAYSVGEAKLNADETAGLLDCQKWFSTAVLVHTFIPVVLVVVGWPIGEHAISCGWLNVPICRVGACVWVWRYVCISCFVGMVTVPFSAMFTAKQYIAELTIYNIISLLVQLCFIFYMHLNPGDWLEKYGFTLCVIGAILQLLISIRAFCLFKECRCRVSYLFDVKRLKLIWAYVVWQTIGGLGYICRAQGLAIVVNRAFGPAMNSAYSIGNTLSIEAAALTGALNHAFIPAITTSCGEHDMVAVRALADRANKYGTLLTAIFAVPLFVEAHEVLVLWLKNPPEGTTLITMAMLVVLVIEKMSLGQVAAINATGKIAKFQIVHGLTWGSALPVAALGVWLGGGLFWVLGALIVTMAVAVLCDVWLAREHTGLLAGTWVRRTLLPLAGVVLASLGISYLPSLVLEESFIRVGVTSVASSLTLFVLSWRFVLDQGDKTLLLARVNSIQNFWRNK